MTVKVEYHPASEPPNDSRDVWIFFSEEHARPDSVGWYRNSTDTWYAGGDDELPPGAIEAWAEFELPEYPIVIDGELARCDACGKPFSASEWEARNGMAHARCD